VSDQHPRGFGSDNHSGVHPEVLEAIAAANDGHAPAYGADPWNARARELFRDHFGPDAEPFLVFNGTAANVLALRALARPGDAVICPATAHLNVDECGAPEAIAGVKLLTVGTVDGKLSPELASSRIARLDDEHAAQPRAISVSQASELGTVYRPAELRALSELAHQHGLLLHVDGARLANAAAALGVGFGDLSSDAGVDVLSFGGTKNGLLAGDAVVFLRPELADRFDRVRKQGMQLASKMRFLAAQFEALLSGDLWLRSASHANAMAGRLGEALAGLEGVEVSQAVEANAVFATVPAEAIPRLQAELPGELPFHVWDPERSEIRLMCSWDTTEADVDVLARALASAL
jgi:threonine aldolase